MLLSLGLSIVWLIFACYVIIAKPETTDNVVGFWACIILSAVWSISYLIVAELKKK